MLFYKILLVLATVSSPLSIDWDTDHHRYPEIPGYRYYYGDIEWGQVIYVGKQDLLGLETEIQLYFSDKKISKALLILGPEGLNQHNCVKKYKKVRKLLTRKYGKYKYIKEKKDPLVDDLIFSSICYPIALNLHEIETFWSNKKYIVKSKLIGEQEEFFIEITYSNRNRVIIHNKKQEDKIIKKL